MKHPRLLYALAGVLLLVAAFIAVQMLRAPVAKAPAAVGLIIPENFAVPHISTSTPPGTPPIQEKQYTYLEVVDSCGPYYQGSCVNARTGPGTQYPVVRRLRTGMVLKVAGTTFDAAGNEWYQIAFEDRIRYPERITTPWYVRADLVQSFQDDGEHWLEKGDRPKTNKHILVDLSERKLYAYDGDTLFMEQAISPGLEITPTPIGTFTVFAMLPSRYMQGPVPGVSTDSYDLPGVPWNLYFTQEGAVIHGAYWHDKFGQPWSHGCVNLPDDQAKKLYRWAELGMTVTVRK